MRSSTNQKLDNLIKSPNQHENNFEKDRNNCIEITNEYIERISFGSIQLKQKIDDLQTFNIEQYIRLV